MNSLACQLAHKRWQSHRTKWKAKSLTFSEFCTQTYTHMQNWSVPNISKGQKFSEDSPPPNTKPPPAATQVTGVVMYPAFSFLDIFKLSQFLDLIKAIGPFLKQHRHQAGWSDLLLLIWVFVLSSVTDPWICKKSNVVPAVYNKAVTSLQGLGDHKNYFLRPNSSDLLW